MVDSVSSPLIDWNSLHCLSDGDKQFETELLQLFVEDTETHLSAIGQAITAQDADQLRRLAHHLKGASANIGALSFAEVAGQLEHEARQGNVQSAPTLYQQMRQIFAEVQETIQASS